MKGTIACKVGVKGGQERRVEDEERDDEDEDVGRRGWRATKATAAAVSCRAGRWFGARTLYIHRSHGCRRPTRGLQ